MGYIKSPVYLSHATSGYNSMRGDNFFIRGYNKIIFYLLSPLIDFLTHLFFPLVFQALQFFFPIF